MKKLISSTISFITSAALLMCAGFGTAAAEGVSENSYIASGEEELLCAAVNLRPHKIVIKRPLKGAFLAGRKPDYSLAGKAIRYDCFVFAD